MNPYTEHLNRIEFVITHACTGRCKHCSQGEHFSRGEHLDGDAAARIVYKIAERHRIESLMTFGGEPLLYPDTVCAIHQAARAVGIPKRQLITNGFFSRDAKKIREVAEWLTESGINDMLLSIDAFHQEAIPLEPVMAFAMAVKNTGTGLRVHPAWLIGKDSDNPYNKITAALLKAFEEAGITASEGNVIFPSGSALKYLGDYFDPNGKYVNPYVEDPYDLRTVSVDPNGDVLGGNIYESDIWEIIERYKPETRTKNS